jgi:signal transduction histidine kinase
MDTIVDDTLTLARQGDTVGEPETVSLSSVAEECWRTTGTDDGSIEVTGDLRLRADPDRLRNLVENLLGNAVEHGGDGVTVRVGALDDGFYVADDGVGIPADERDSVFALGHTSAEDGTGFGLAIVNEIAEAHGWTVSIGDAEVGGARFEIRDVTTV